MFRRSVGQRTSQVAQLDRLGGTISCNGITVRSNQGDFFGQWSAAIGPVDFPATGGTFTKSGSNSSLGVISRQASGTYTATPD